jgi:ssDNA-binding Zn-finger/Zn-ribbon topoisomerase 1
VGSTVVCPKCKCGLIGRPTSGGTPSLPESKPSASSVAPSGGPPKSAIEEKWRKTYGQKLQLIEGVVVEIFTRFVGKTNRLYIFPDIPEQKLSKAEATYARLVSSAITLCLYDDTMWGSASCGFVFTTKAIYWNYDTEGEENVEQKQVYADLFPSDIRVESGWLGNYVYLTPTHWLKTISTAVDQNTVNGIATFLRHAAAFSLAATGGGRASYATTWASLTEAASSGRLNTAISDMMMRLTSDDCVPVQSATPVTPKKTEPAPVVSISDTVQAQCANCNASYTLSIQKYGGKRIKCKKCQSVITVPLPENELEVVEDTPTVPPSAPTAPRGPTLDGISDRVVADRAAEKRAAIKSHAVPDSTDAAGDDHVVFSGDAPCPQCKEMMWVEWKPRYATMKCPKCNYSFNEKEAVAFLSTHEPKDNYNPDDNIILVHLKAATEYLQEGKWDLADAESRSVLDICPTSSLAYLVSGLARHGKGVATGDQNCFRGALGSYTAAIEFGFDDSEMLVKALYERGRLYADDLGRPDMATQDFTRVLELDPNHIEARSRLDDEVSSPSSTPGSTSQPSSKGFFGNLWSLFTRWKCPNCGRRSAENTDTERISDVTQKVQTRYDFATHQSKQMVVNVWAERRTFCCEDCGHEWQEDHLCSEIA